MKDRDGSENAAASALDAEGLVAGAWVGDVWPSADLDGLRACSWRALARAFSWVLM